MLEIVEDHRGDTYRAVCAMRFADVVLVYVLHAFQNWLIVASSSLVAALLFYWLTNQAS